MAKQLVPIVLFQYDMAAISKGTAKEATPVALPIVLCSPLQDLSYH